MTTPLRISLTQRVLTHNGYRYDSLGHDWYAYLSMHDLRFIPNRPDQDFHAIAQSSDVIVFTGGDRDPARDLVEESLFAAAGYTGRPIVGICHGFQRLTQMMGGAIEPIDGHANTGHAVVDASGMRHWVNSYHRFRVSEVPRGAAILATDPDGNCEGWISGGVCGVMWHPERRPFDWLPGEIAQLLFP